MAAARQRNDNNPYEDGGGGGGGFGKFRKRPFRKPHSTPYDRPPTALRNPILAATGNDTNGWLSKLVDPAQRLITSGAHKLFASLFRKRLPPPPPPQPPEPEANVGASNSHQEAVPKDSCGIQELAVNEIDYPVSSSGRGGLTELELILKQKTFTKSEFDRLTALLQSRTVNLPLGNQEKSFEAIPSKVVLSQERKEAQVTPVKDNRLERCDIATPFASSSVLVEDVATPAELAKAYMGSRPSKVSPPMLGLRGRSIGEDSVAQVNRPFLSKSPIVPRSSVRGVCIENGFMTPRSRGRSAIYNMARTPYSRLNSTSTLQGTGSEIDVFGASSSSSQSMRENGIYSGSKQVALKRRSSVFDNDIGSVGPIRRIRQKSNLLPSSGTHSIRGNAISDAAKHPSSSQKEPVRSGTLTENVDNMTRGSGTSSVPSKSSEVASQILQQLDVLVPSRDKSPTKLSPSMLRGQALKSLDNVESSKFMETVKDNNKLDVNHGGSLPDTQKPVFQNEDKVQGNGTAKPFAIYDKSASSLNGVHPANLFKKNASDVKSISLPRLNSVIQTSPQKKRAFQMSAHEDFLDLDDDDHSDKTPSTTLSTEREKVAGAVAETKTSSVDASEFVKTAAFPEGKNQLISSSNQKASDRLTVADKNTALTVADKNTALTVAAASLTGVNSEQTTVVNQSNRVSPPKETNADALVFSFEKKAVSPKEPNGFPSTFDFNSKASVAVSTLPVVTGPTGITFGISSDNKSNNSSSLGFNAFNATKLMSKEPESDKADGGNNLKAGVFFSSAETVSSGVTTSSPSTTSGFLFSGIPSNASVTNGAIPTPSVSFADKALVSNTISSQRPIGDSTDAVVRSNSTAITATAANSNGSSSLSQSTLTPSSVSGSVFKFSSSLVPSASTLSTSEATGVALTEPKMKETSFGNLSSVPFSSTLSSISNTGGGIFSAPSSAIKSTGSSIVDGTSAVASSSSNSFGLSPAVATTGGSGIFSFNAGGSAAVSNQSQGFNPFSAASTQASLAGGSTAVSNQSQGFNPFSAAGTQASLAGGSTAVPNQSQGFHPFSAASTQASSAGTLFSTSSQSIPIQFASSASAPSFGLTANSAASSGSSLFTTTISTDKPFSSGLTSAGNPVSSTTSSTPVVFGSSSFVTPNFASPFSSSSSTGFLFGASSASGATTASTSTAPMVFGGPTNASSAASVFNFSSTATATPSQPVFVSTPSSPYAFGSSPVNNDQMNMEDSMAEDTVQATTSTAPPAFGQHPVTPSSFVFGSATPAGGNQFAPSSASVASPFQFGGQPNLALAAPQNQSPFQASGSLEFNPGGSFSLGTGDKSNRRYVKVRKNQQRKK